MPLSLLERLRAHDWYYAYSDDSRVYQAGSRVAGELKMELRKLGCPFLKDASVVAPLKATASGAWSDASEEKGWWRIHSAIAGYVLEDFQVDGEGKYFKPLDPEGLLGEKGWKYDFARLDRSEMVSRVEADEILGWLEKNGGGV